MLLQSVCCPPHGPPQTSASTGKQRYRLQNQPSPKLSHLVGIGRAHAAVHLDPWISPLLIAHPAQLPDLLHLVLNELLAAKAGVDCRQSGRTGDSASYQMQHRCGRLPCRMASDPMHH